MTDATFSDLPRIACQSRAPTVTLPKPNPFGAPVLLSDCVTPLGGETLLSLLMKRLVKADERD